MRTTSNNSPTTSSFTGILIVLVGVVMGLAGGFLVGMQPLYMGLAVGVVAALVYFFASFPQAVLALLVIRSAVDVFSELKIPSAVAIGIDVLTIAYVFVQCIKGKKVHTDGFWWLFAIWILLQSLWVILLPLNGLGLDGAYLIPSIREWIRLFSWLMIYLLVMQLKDQIPPQTMLSQLLLGLVFPLALALLQMFVPSILPPLLSADAGGSIIEIASNGESRIRGTLGHPNGFATYLLLFMGLTYWRSRQSIHKLPWLILLGAITVFFVSTKALFSLMMLVVCVLVLIAPRINLLKVMGGLLFAAVVIGLFASTTFGQERLASLTGTPLLNPDMDISRAILLSQTDNNSFNWRLLQWSYLLQQWQQYTLLGYGLGLTTFVSTNALLPHNDYVRALVEGGIFGLAAFVGFFFIQVLWLVKLMRQAAPGSSQRQLCEILLAVLISIPVGMLTENIWSHTTMFFYWWTIFAIAGWDWEDERSVVEVNEANYQTNYLQE
jgi:O-antigen ligase